MPAQTPEECDALFERYVNEGNLDALVDLYEPEATLVPAPGQVRRRRHRGDPRGPQADVRRRPSR